MSINVTRMSIKVTPRRFFFTLRLEHPEITAPHYAHIMCWKMPDRSAMWGFEMAGYPSPSSDFWVTSETAEEAIDGQLARERTLHCRARRNLSKLAHVPEVREEAIKVARAMEAMIAAMEVA